MAWLKARARLRRARDLYACGQAIASRAEPASSERAARLYRRGLQLLTPGTGSSTAAKTPERQSARDQLRTGLAERGLLGYLRAHPRLARLLLWAAAATLAAWFLMRFFEPDLAEGKRWVASSAWGTFPASGVMSGEAPIDGRFHTIEEQEPWVQLDLGELRSVHAVRVENRTNCCKERALPLIFELSVDGRAWKRVAYRRVLFDTYTQSFAATDARYVRLRVDRRTSLHLRRISVY